MGHSQTDIFSECKCFFFWTSHVKMHVNNNVHAVKVRFHFKKTFSLLKKSHGLNGPLLLRL